MDLPLGVQIEKIEVGRILLGKSNNPVVESGAVSYQFDHQNHQLNLVSLRLPWHNFSGSATLNTTTPFKLDGQIVGSGELDGKQADSAVAVNGSLQSPELLVQLDNGDSHFAVNGKLRWHISLGTRF